MENAVVKKGDINLKIVEASAGSGKTTKLAAEYLSLLYLSFKKVIKKRDPDENFTSADLEEFRKTLNSIIAVTFGNLAAKQMGERILDYLQEFSVYENCKEGVIAEVFSEVSERSGLKSEEDRKKISSWSKFFLSLITTCYSDFKTGTIDSLSASILRVISPEIKGLTADFNFKENLDVDLKNLTEDFLTEKVKSDWSEVEAALEDIIILSKISWDINLDKTLAGKIGEIFKSGKSPEKKNREELKEKFWKKRDELVRLGKKFHEVIGEFRKRKDCINGVTFRKDNDDLFLSLGKDNITNFLKIAQRKWVKKDCSNILKDVATNEDIEKVREVFDPFVKSLKEFIDLYSYFKVAAFSDLSHDFAEFFKKRIRDTVYIQEISNLIEKNLGVDFLPYLYIKLSERYCHYLIDEFQDTSVAQIKMLAPLAGDAILSKKDTSSLFIVGDRKQAIYLWRGIEIGMLDQKKITDLFGIGQSVIEGKNYKENLPKNFRSDGEIVEFNNSFWKKENLEILNNFGLSDIFDENYSSAIQECGSGEKAKRGYVELNFVQKGEVEDIYSAIDEVIRKIKAKGWKNRDIAILLRKNKNIKSLFRYLTEKGHECITDESASLMNAPLVREIISFMKFLDFPPDNLSFYEFSKSSLLKKAAQSEGIDYIYSDEIYFGIKKAFYTVFREKNEALWRQFVEPFFKNVGFMTAYDIFQDIVYRFRIFENFSESSFFLMKLGEILHDLEVESKTSISSFLTYTEKILAEKDKKNDIDIPQGEDKIRLLTIHGAKGLEFKNVILNLSEKLEGQKSNIFLDEGGVRYIIKELSEIVEKLSAIYNKKIIDFNTEGLNLLYVAMTRAIHGVYLISERIENERR